MMIDFRIEKEEEPRYGKRKKNARDAWNAR
jgi:hypothetical protein